MERSRRFASHRSLRSPQWGEHPAVIGLRPLAAAADLRTLQVGEVLEVCTAIMSTRSGCSHECHLTMLSCAPDFAEYLPTLLIDAVLVVLQVQRSHKKPAMSQKPEELDYRELQRECKAAGVNAKGCAALAHS